MFAPGSATWPPAISAIFPSDFDYVLHLATYRASGLDYDRALAVNAEGTQLLLEHCRGAKAALVMSTFEVYKPQPDPWHVYAESDALGDANSQFDPTYSVSKIAQEAVARACARSLDLPVVIPRMNASYGANGGLLAYHLDFLLAGQPIRVRWDPAVYSPIHQDDINAQIEPLLAAASVPATVVNWSGDEPVTVGQWTTEMGELTGREPTIVRVRCPVGSGASSATTTVGWPSPDPAGCRGAMAYAAWWSSAAGGRPRSPLGPLGSSRAPGRRPTSPTPASSRGGPLSGGAPTGRLSARQLGQASSHPFVADRDGRAELLGEVTDPELLDHPPHLVEGVGVGSRRGMGDEPALLIGRRRSIRTHSLPVALAGRRRACRGGVRWRSGSGPRRPGGGCRWRPRSRGRSRFS